MATNKKTKTIFRWTLFQDFDSIDTVETGKQKIAEACDSVNAPLNGDNHIEFFVMNLYPDYDLTGTETGGYRVVICVIGYLTEQTQREMLIKFMRFGWHF